MPDLSRQQGLVKSIVNDRIHIIGCGGVGSWIALWLAKALPHASIHLWDGDFVDESNLHRTPYLERHVGRLKTDALHEALGSPSLWQHGAWSPVTSMFAPGDVVIGAVDSMRVRREIYSHALAVDAVYYDVGAEEAGCNLSSSPAEFEIAGADEHQGYFTPVFIGPVAMVAALCVWQ